MDRNIIVLLTIFLILPAIAHSVDVFTIEETEKISLEPNVTDPDADSLIITYTFPLDENGEWQTTYGDAGEYKAKIDVSDGVTIVSRDALILVKKKEEKPVIESFAPEQDTLSIEEAESVAFSVLVTDLNKDELSYEWFLDNQKLKDGQEFYYETTYNDAGQHKVSVFVSDGTTKISREWNINVADVDVEDILDNVKDVSVNENEVASLELPDFEEYGLLYSISEPIGNDNEWQTTYDDEGAYEVEVHVEGKGFRDDKTVNVIVNDVDRAPVFDNIGNRIINENEELKIALSANDPDKNEITYSANNLPEGSTLEDNVFTWNPSHDTVKKDNFIERVISSFRPLSKNFYVQFAASSNDKKLVQNVIITVKDVNRAPVLEDIEQIAISEGEAIKISPKAYDLDNDRVKLSYSGFMDSDIYQSDFDDAGIYSVKVTASDGALETSKFAEVIINQSNRVPVLDKIQSIKASEGDEIAVLLNAHDPDEDEVTFYLDNPPQDSSFKGNAFLWKPDFGVAGKKETKKFDLVFVASDGKAETRQIAKAEIIDKNRQPKIINATKSIATNVNKPVLMYVKAIDEDGDELTYTWNFGFFEKYKATAIHQRVFTKRGAKVIKVTVSDGVDKVEHTININVI